MSADELPDYAPVPETAFGPAWAGVGSYLDLGTGSQVHP